MFKNLLFVSSSFIYANLLGYIFHFYVSRKLSPEGYGEFMVLYSFLLTVGNITAILSVVGVKSIVRNFDKRYEVLRYLRLIGAGSGLLVCGIGVIISPMTAKFLKISSENYLFIVSLCWLLMFVLSVERAFLQASNRFGIFSFSSCVELTVRLFAAFIFLSAGLYINGAILSSLVGVVSAFVMVLTINRNIFGDIKKVEIKEMIKTALYVSPSGFFVYMDDIFIKRIFDPTTAGLYASASIVGKALIWLCIAIFSVFFPKFVSLKHSERKWILYVIGINLGIFFLAEVCILSIGKTVFLHLFGRSFLEGFKILPLYILAIFPLTLSINFIGINTARDKSLFLIYFHFICYLLGFVVLNFKEVSEYLLYIGVLNSVFCFFYLKLYF